MYDTNTAILLGRLTRDPELKYTPNGDAVCNFSIANNSTGKEEMVSFFNIVAWGKTAENISKFTSKGSQVIIEGSLRQRRYETQDGKKGSVIEVLAYKVQFLGGKKDENKPAGDNGYYPDDNNIPY